MVGGGSIPLTPLSGRRGNYQPLNNGDSVSDSRQPTSPHSAFSSASGTRRKAMPAASSSRNRRVKRNSLYEGDEGDRERLLGDETNADDAGFGGHLDDELRPGARDIDDDASSTKTVCLTYHDDCMKDNAR